MIAWLLVKIMKGALLVYDVAYVLTQATAADRAHFRAYKQAHGASMTWLQKHQVVWLQRRHPLPRASKESA